MPSTTVVVKSEPLSEGFDPQFASNSSQSTTFRRSNGDATLPQKSLEEFRPDNVNDEKQRPGKAEPKMEIVRSEFSTTAVVSKRRVKQEPANQEPSNCVAAIQVVSVPNEIPAAQRSADELEVINFFAEPAQEAQTSNGEFVAEERAVPTKCEPSSVLADKIGRGNSHSREFTGSSAGEKRRNESSNLNGVPEVGAMADSGSDKSFSSAAPTAAKRPKVEIMRSQFSRPVVVRIQSRGCSRLVRTNFPLAPEEPSSTQSAKSGHVSTAALQNPASHGNRNQDEEDKEFATTPSIMPTITEGIRILKEEPPDETAASDTQPPHALGPSLMQDKQVRLRKQNLRLETTVEDPLIRVSMPQGWRSRNVCESLRLVAPNSLPSAFDCIEKRLETIEQLLETRRARPLALPLATRPAASSSTGGQQARDAPAESSSGGKRRRRPRKPREPGSTESNWWNRVCNLCQARVGVGLCLKNHVTNVHIADNKLFCGYCDYANTGNTRMMDRHLLRMHYGQDTKMTDKRGDFLAEIACLMEKCFPDKNGAVPALHGAGETARGQSCSSSAETAGLEVEAEDEATAEAESESCPEAETTALETADKTTVEAEPAAEAAAVSDGDYQDSGASSSEDVSDWESEEEVKMKKLTKPTTDGPSGLECKLCSVFVADNRRKEHVMGQHIPGDKVFCGYCPFKNVARMDRVMHHFRRMHSGRKLKVIDMRGEFQDQYAVMLKECFPTKKVKTGLFERFETHPLKPACAQCGEPVWPEKRWTHLMASHAADGHKVSCSYCPYGHAWSPTDVQRHLRRQHAALPLAFTDRRHAFKQSAVGQRLFTDCFGEPPPVVRRRRFRCLQKARQPVSLALADREDSPLPGLDVQVAARDSAERTDA